VASIGRISPPAADRDRVDVPPAISAVSAATQLTDQTQPGDHPHNRTANQQFEQPGSPPLGYQVPAPCLLGV
jgi:hypothetical protein